VDLPKRCAEAAVSAGTGRNLGLRAGPGSATRRRLFYIDWPLLDRHRDAIASSVDLWIDTQRSDQPALLDGNSLRSTLAALARQPFRTRPTFNTTPWGGHWAQRTLGLNTEAMALIKALGTGTSPGSLGLKIRDDGYVDMTKIRIPLAKAASRTELTVRPEGRQRPRQIGAIEFVPDRTIFSGVRLERVDFSQASLENAVWEAVHFERVRFDGARMRIAHLQHLFLDRARSLIGVMIGRPAMLL